jgi:hypothetical protein
MLRYLLFTCDDPKTYHSLCLLSKNAYNLSKEYEPMKLKQFSTKIVLQIERYNEEKSYTFLPNGNPYNCWTTRYNDTGTTTYTIFDKSGLLVYHFYNDMGSGLSGYQTYDKTRGIFAKKENGWIFFPFFKVLKSNLFMSNIRRKFFFKAYICLCGFYHNFVLWNGGWKSITLFRKCPNTVRTKNIPLKKLYNSSLNHHLLPTLRTKVVKYSKEFKGYPFFDNCVIE